MAILAGGLDLPVQVAVGVPVPHDVPRGVAVDAVHPFLEVDVRGDVGQVPVAVDHRGPRSPAAGGDERVVAVVQPFVGKGDPAAPVVAAGAYLVVRQGGEGVGRGKMALPPHRGVPSLVASGVVEGEVARGAAGGVAGGVRAGGLQPEMAQGAELAVQLPGQVFEPGDSLEPHGSARFVVRPGVPRGVGISVFPFPRELDVPDHPRVGVHEAGLHPFQLVPVAIPAPFLPRRRSGRVFPAEHRLVRGFLGFGLRVPPVAGNAGAVAGGDGFDPFVARLAGGPLRREAAGAAQERQNEKKRQKRGMGHEFHELSILMIFIEKTKKSSRAGLTASTAACRSCRK